MVIKGQLILALDFEANKKKPAKPTKYTYRLLPNETWYFVSSGPTYSNTYKITEFDEEGERKLFAMEEAVDPITKALLEPNK